MPLEFSLQSNSLDCGVLSDIWEDWSENRIYIFDENAPCQYWVDPETSNVWLTDVECDIHEVRWDNLSDFIMATADCYESGRYDEVESKDFWDNKSLHSSILEVWRKYGYRGEYFW